MKFAVVVFPGSNSDYDAFYAKEREFRERMQYPPSVAMVSLVVKGRTALANALF